MDLQAVRTELAALAPSGWHSYDSLPGTAQLPAAVVSLPDRVRIHTSGLLEVQLPLILVIGNQYTVDSETKLLDAVSAFIAAYRGKTGTAFRSCTVVDVTEFLSVTVGGTAGLSCSVNLTLLVNT